MSSTELLSIMKERNRLVSNLGNESEDEEELFRPDGQQSSGGGEERVQQGDMDLLTDIRNFVAFQVRESSRNYQVEKSFFHFRLNLMERRALRNFSRNSSGHSQARRVRYSRLSFSKSAILVETLKEKEFGN